MTASNTVTVEHALLRHKLATLRDRKCPAEVVQHVLFEAGLLLCAEVLRDLPPTIVLDNTGNERISLRRDSVIGVPILRAGLVFSEALTRLLPSAPIGHIGIFRPDEKLDPINYFTSLPPSNRQSIFVIMDPVIGSGKTIIKAIEILRSADISPNNIRVVSLVAYSGGLQNIDDHPDCKGAQIYVGAIDDRLDEYGFLIPGIGDAGDRVYSTMSVKGGDFA